MNTTDSSGKSLPDASECSGETPLPLPLAKEPSSGRGVFVTTRWTVVLTAGRSDAVRAQEALARLCESYWYPLYGAVLVDRHSEPDRTHPVLPHPAGGTLNKHKSGFVPMRLWRKLSGMAEIGKRNVLTMVRDSTPGIYLDGGEHGEILLPNRYVPRGIKPGDRLEVFVYLDSEDRLVASTETPRATVGEMATLKVISVNRRVGAFLDWGLAKDLLLPFREQTGPVKVGQAVVVRITLDERTQRIIATMKLDKDAAAEPPNYRAGQPVEFVITEKTPLGYKALVEGMHPGLIYHEGVSFPVTIGQKFKGFIRNVRPDGKLDLSLDESGYRRVRPLAMRIVEALERNGGRLNYDDDSPPEAIRQAFGASKKAFKQALGTLYRMRRIRFSEPGIELLDNSTWSPGNEAPVKPKVRAKHGGRFQ